MGGDRRHDEDLPSPEQLARAFAVALSHERRFGGGTYASAVVIESTAEERRGAAVEPTGAYTGISSTVPETSSEATGPRESVDQVRQRVVARQAAAWTPERKLAYLRDKNIGDCQRCRLCERRTEIVFGVGNPQARIMFVGEAPGAEEDRRGEPFVGAAGRRLDAWIEALGLARNEVYIANVIKCRPPGNRDPRADEIARCSPFLHAQIRAIEPELIVALGRFAGAQMIGREAKMYQMRGSIHEYVEPKSKRRTPVAVIYHPSYVLRREGKSPRSEQPNARSDGKSENETVLADLRAALASIERGGTS